MYYTIISVLLTPSTFILLFLLFQEFTFLRLFLTQRIPTLQDDEEGRRRKNGKKYPCVVGGGWSFFLQRYSVDPDRDVIFDTKSGIFLSDPTLGDVWHAGSTLYKVQNHYKQSDETLFSHPSIRSSTLGGWIMSSSHGGGGSLWKSSFGNIYVTDMETGEGIVVSKQFFTDEKSIEELSRYMIRYVTILPSKDVWCTKQVYKMNSLSEYESFLEEETLLRMIQIGKRGMMSLLWTPKKEDLKHKDPHFFSREGLWIQADVLSIFQSSSSRKKEWFSWPVEPIRNWKSNVKLSTANDFTPPPLPFLTWIGLFFTNFEVFLFRKLEAKELMGFCEGLSDLFLSEFGGRCELRYSQSGKLFLDFVVYRWSNIRPLFVFLHSYFQDEPIALHRGKHQVDISPCRKYTKQ